MKNIKINISQFLAYIIVISLTMNTACKKEDNDPVIHLLQKQRIIEIYELQDGVKEYKEMYKYEGEQLVGYDFFLTNEVGEWYLRSRYTFEYPLDDVIIEKRFGSSDTLSIPSSEWYNKFSGDHLTEMIYSSSPDGVLEPIIKTTWTYEQDRLMERWQFRYKDHDWLPYYKTVNYYQNNDWIKGETYRYTDGIWKIFYKAEIKYNNGLAIEMSGYEFSEYTNLWRLNEYIEMEYFEGQFTAMHFYDIYSDSLRWDYSISVTYNESNNPTTYTIQNNNGPEEVLYLTYEEGKGNFTKATAGNSGYSFWPWFPTPVKGTGNMPGYLACRPRDEGN